jgi:alkylation response protein AidB-like acyl-CoA dehydrogenase
MDFTMTEAQTALGALTREILADRKPSVGFDRPLWTDLASAGVLSAALPEAAGGDGYGLLEQCTIASEIGRSVSPLPYVEGIIAAASAIARFGSPEQVQRWAAPAGRGELLLTVASPAGTVHAGQSGPLDGECPAVPAAPYADLILVPVGDSVYLVEPTDGGVSIEPQHIAGGPGAGHLALDSVTVPADRVLGSSAAGWLRSRLTVGLCATQLGVLERGLELTAEYAGTRVQFGRPIGTFQAVAQRLADSYIDVQGVRLTLWQAAWRLAADLPCPTEVATAKFWAADAGHRVAHTAVHLHGGVGIDLEGVVQRYFLAAKYHEFALGGATEQLLHIGESLRTAELDA